MVLVKYFLTSALFFGVTVAQAFKVEVIHKGFEHPWSLAFISPQEVLITERRGKLYRFHTVSKQKIEITGLLPVYAQGQGGLLDVILDVNYEKNAFIYLSFTEGNSDSNQTAVMRGVLKGNQFTDPKVIWRQNRSYGNGYHFGSRMVMTSDGFLFVTLGERSSERDEAQNLQSHLGKVVRLTRDGAAAPGNPFPKEKALPDIWSYGHRNVQGAALHPETKELWTHEHGPRGGDEVNITRAGLNYGWPVVTFGREYYGPKIGEGTGKMGMQSPLHQWTPSIAPSGMAFYTGTKFPQWKGNLFVGALAGQALHRLELAGDKVMRTEVLLKDRSSRIRDVRQGADGFLYVLTDENDGALLVLKP